MKRLASLAIVLALFVACATQGRMDFDRDLSPEKKEELLRDRISEHWKAMIAEDWFKAYTYYDPFFRAKITKEGFVQGKGVLKYYSFNIERIEMKGNIADIKVKVDFDAPELIILGRKTSVPRQERIIDETWLWIYDTWYKEFRGSMKGARFTDY